MHTSIAFLLLAASASLANAQWEWQDPLPQRNHLSGVSSTGETAQIKATSLQIPFVENQGQIKENNVLYYTHLRKGIAYITNTGEIIYSLPASLSSNAWSPFGMSTNTLPGYYSIMEGMEHSASLEVCGEDPALAKISYFRGSDPGGWHSNLPVFNILNLGEVYPGITFKLKATENNVEKLFFIQPLADPSLIRLRISGAGNLAVNEYGELEAQTPVGVVTFSKPYAYQILGKQIEPIDAGYSVNGNKYGFSIGSYDPGRELIIDPLLSSTFLGGNHNEYIEDMLFDSAGNLYVTGWVASTDFPTTIGAYDTSHNGGGDVFVSKFDGGLQNLLASTFIGGATFDQNPAIARDNNDNIFICGMTRSNDFPTTPNAFDTSYSDWSDCFISKFNSDLQNLLASTYLGGTNNVGEFGFDISVNDNGFVYVAGTAGANFPTTPGAYDETINSFTDAFVSKLDNNLTTLVASTYLGGNASDLAYAIAFDDNGNVYTTGRTESGDFPLSAGAFDSTHNGGIYDAFLSKLDSNLQSLLASTYLGGSGNDAAWDMVLDNTGNVLLTGETWSVDFPATASAFDTTYNGPPDAFISKLDNNLTNLVASTFLGGSGSEIGYDIALNSSGNLFVAGMTSSIDFPVTPGAYDSTRDVTDAFISKFDPDLANLGASTYLGGTDVDQGFALTLNSSGEVYIGGETASTDFPTTANAYDTTYNGFDRDAFITRIDGNLSGGVVGVLPGPTGNFLPSFYLNQNYPNPFNPSTTIEYSIPHQATVQIKVLDVLGREVATLLNEEKPAGTYTVRWDAIVVASGVYFYRLTAGGFVQTRKMVLVR